MQNIDSIGRIRPIIIATTMAIAAITLSACGGSSSNSKTPEEVADASVNRLNCTDSNTKGARVICIGSTGELSSANVQKSLTEALAQAQTGDTFVLPQGRYSFDNTIEFNGEVDNIPVSNLTFRGAGMKKTIIDTKGASGDGFLINDTDNLIFEDFGIYESNNNALKVKGSDGVIIRRLATIWETDYQPTNGAYGIYPVECKNILIEDSFVQGSADAGIYVGQSEDIVVRNNTAIKNVAGIEIENSKRADVYGNLAEGNTGGILIFDLPIGNGVYGAGVRIFDNEVIANNAPNFANKSAFAGGVHIVPPGTGVIVLSTSDVEIYENTIKDHQTTSIAVTSYILADEKVVSEPNQNVGTEVMSYGDIHPYATMFMDGWSPLVRNINIHDNTISVAAGIDDPKGDLIKDIIAGYQGFHANFPSIADDKTTVPHILYDGLGELLASTPNPSGQGESILQALVGGINSIATGVKANISDAGEFTEVDTDLFSAYPIDGGVCQSGNNINSVDLFASSVFETTATAATFGATGPLSKLEQLGAGDVSMAWNIVADPNGVMSCGEGYQGTAATVTFGESKFGCLEDDKENASCLL